MKRIVLFFLTLATIAAAVLIPKITNNHMHEEKQQALIALFTALTGDQSYDRHYTAEEGKLNFTPARTMNAGPVLQTILKINALFEEMEPEYNENENSLYRLEYYRWLYEGMYYKMVVKYDYHYHVDYIHLAWYKNKKQL